ncbi:hypothetical protein [Nocardia terpenica]
MGATALFIPPAVLMGVMLWRHQRRAAAQAVGGQTRGRDCG